MDNFFRFVKSFSSKTNPGELHDVARLAASKFDHEEIALLQMTWQDLADRSSGKGIDKDTFLQYFPLNGLLGERLFVQFDNKKTGYIDFDEFIIGLSTVCRGSKDDKIHFVFNMYDVSHDNTVSKQELTTLLNHIPKAVLHDSYTPSHYDAGYDSSSSVANEETTSREDELEEVDQYTNHDLVEKAFEECDLNHTGRLTYEEFKMWVERNPSVMDYIESILPYHGPKDNNPHHDKNEILPRQSTRLIRAASNAEMAGMHSRSVSNADGLSYRPSQSYVDMVSLNNSSHGISRVNSISRYSRAISTSNAPMPTEQTLAVPPSPSNRTPSPSLSRTSSDAGEPREISASIDDSAFYAEEQVRDLLQQAMNLTKNEALKRVLFEIVDSLQSPMSQAPSYDPAYSNAPMEIVSKEGFLWKKGKALHLWSKRFYLISGNCMYYYLNKAAISPKGVIFLTGSLIEKLVDPDLALKGYYGFELLHQDLCTGEHHKHDQRVLFCRSEAERDEWVSLLQRAAAVVPIEDDYVLGKELGRGRFSVVKECVHKKTNVHCAVKIIEKASIEPEEKALLRTEIAVLKLVNHPNIIRMEGLYENKQHIYIVMEKLSGGELFERIVGRPRFSDIEAAKLIKPLLESVAYLHDLGIVHRDLKPENILCGDNLEDLKIADFGLSKMVLPKEKMDAACGTLSYVAPEVLTMAGYGKEADLWSVGVIMFLLMCGKLPFDGQDQNEIIKNTIQAELKVNPNVWNKMNEDAKSLITSLLARNPKDRISARDALKHPFILNFYPHKRHSISAPNFDKLDISPPPREKTPAPEASSSNSPRPLSGGESIVSEESAQSGADSLSPVPESDSRKTHKVGMVISESSQV